MRISSQRPNNWIPHFCNTSSISSDCSQSEHDGIIRVTFATQVHPTLKDGSPLLPNYYSY